MPCVCVDSSESSRREIPVADTSIQDLGTLSAITPTGCENVAMSDTSERCGKVFEGGVVARLEHLEHENDGAKLLVARHQEDIVDLAPCIPPGW